MPLTTDDAGDEEIIDIFVEEAGEVFQGIDRDLAVWGSARRIGMP
jgi:hypothetical protein